MHVGDVVLLLCVVIIATLFVGLIWVGREYYRLSSYTLDSRRVKSLISLQPAGKEVEAAAERLWSRLVEDSEQLSRIAQRIRALCSAGEDEQRNTVP